MVSLSATVSNAEEFGDWLGEVRGDTEVVVAEHRPVPLWQHMMVGQGMLRPVRRRDRDAGPLQRPAALKDSARVNPELLDALRGFDRGTDRRGRLEDAGGPRGRPRARSAAAGAERRGRRRAVAGSAAGRAGPRSSSGSTATGCCPRSPSSSAGPAATPPSASCWPATCA